MSNIACKWKKTARRTASPRTPACANGSQNSWVSIMQVNSKPPEAGIVTDVEHRLQMEENRQTHSIPADASVRERLAKLMGFNNAGEFEATRSRHSNRCRTSLANGRKPPDAQHPRGRQRARTARKTHGFQ